MVFSVVFRFRFFLSVVKTCYIVLVMVISVSKRLVRFGFSVIVVGLLS